MDMLDLARLVDIFISLLLLASRMPSPRGI